MSPLVGAVSITDKRGAQLRLQERNNRATAVNWTRERYRFAYELNGYHCGHWHATPEDALACMIGKGVKA